MKSASRRYLRFVLRTRNADSGVRDGMFSAAYAAASDRAEYPAAVRQQLKELLNWFAENLKTPDRFHASHSKGRSDRATKGISWLKPEAVEHIAKMHELASTLGECGYVVDVITSSRPGYVVYEDRYQIVAEAFADVGA